MTLVLLLTLILCSIFLIRKGIAIDFVDESNRIVVATIPHDTRIVSHSYKYVFPELRPADHPHCPNM